MNYPSLQVIANKIEKIIDAFYSGNRRKIISILLILFSIYIIGYVLYSNRDFLLDYDWNLKYRWIIVAIIIFTVDFLLSLYAWHLLVKKLTGIDKFLTTSRLYLISNLARRLPGSVWYIADRAILYKEVGLKPRTTTALAGLEIVMFVISGFLTFLITIPFWLDLFLSESSPTLIWIGLIPVVIGLLAFTNPKVLFKIWTNLSAETLDRPLSYLDTFCFFVVYLGTWILGGLVIFALVSALYPLSNNHIMTVIGIWSLSGSIAILGISALPIFSVRDISMILFLSQIIPPPIALLVAILARVLWAAGELSASMIALRTTN
ncbi:MAG: hypothetical protein ACI85U_002349, partial [Candidatus Promineifilaceae bacterium]